jgi:serine/threonine protein kinase
VAVEDVLLPRNRKSFNDIHIVFELFDTDLNHMIRSETQYDMTHRRWILYQILQGLKHMHSVDVYHRDLKPGNILINANCDCKICDFGMARAKRPGAAEEDETVALWTDYVASRWYRAPELICCYLTRYTAAIDIWSVGCIASELLLRKALFPGKNGEAQLRLITDLLGAPSAEDMESLRSARVRELLRTMRTKKPAVIRDFFPPQADDQELALITRMLRFSARRRITAAETIDDAYFQDIRDLPGAQIPYTDMPELDPDDFIYDDAKQLTKEQLRETLYAEMANYHPEVLGGEGTDGLGRSSGEESGAESGEGGAIVDPTCLRRPGRRRMGSSKGGSGTGGSSTGGSSSEGELEPSPAVAGAGDGTQCFPRRRNSKRNLAAKQALEAETRTDGAQTPPAIAAPT